MGCTAKSPLIKASSKGDSFTAQKLIQEGANINEVDRNGITPLMHSIWERKTETTKTLIKMGADINIQDKNGDSALHVAVYNCDASMAKILIDNGADVNAKTNSGVTALHYAAQCKEPEVTKILIENGADASIKNNDGQTALKYATDYKMIDNIILIRTRYEGNDDQTSSSFDDALRAPSRINPDQGAFLIPPGKEKAYVNAISDCNDLIIPYKKGLLFATGPVGYGAGLLFDAATTQGKFQKCMEKMGFTCIKNCLK
jgi:ankyrin repeat protein